MKFKIGDAVEFELQPCKKYPRWNFSRDMGRSGKWAQGTVVWVRVHSIVVEYTIHRPDWHWPIEGHPNYTENQWSRPGYLRHATTKDLKDLNLEG